VCLLLFFFKYEVQNSSHFFNHFIFLPLLLNHKIKCFITSTQTTLKALCLPLIRYNHTDTGHSAIVGAPAEDLVFQVQGKYLAVAFSHYFCRLFPPSVFFCNWPLKNLQIPILFIIHFIICSIVRGLTLNRLICFKAFLKYSPPQKPFVAVLNVVKSQEEWCVKHKQCLFALDERANAAVFPLTKYFSACLFFFLSMNPP